MEFCVAVAVVVERDVVCPEGLWECHPLCEPVLILVLVLILTAEDLWFSAEPALERVSRAVGEEGAHPCGGEP